MKGLGSGFDTGSRQAQRLDSSSWLMTRRKRGQRSAGCCEGDGGTTYLAVDLRGEAHHQHLSRLQVVRHHTDGRTPQSIRSPCCGRLQADLASTPVPHPSVDQPRHTHLSSADASALQVEGLVLIDIRDRGPVGAVHIPRAHLQRGHGIQLQPHHTHTIVQESHTNFRVRWSGHIGHVSQPLERASSIRLSGFQQPSRAPGLSPNPLQTVYLEVTRTVQVSLSMMERMSWSAFTSRARGWCSTQTGHRHT